MKGMHLPVTMKEIQAGYLSSRYFKDLYLYLAQNKLANTKTASCKVEMLAEKLFKLVTTPKKETALLAISETCAHKFITLYHSSLFAGHKGVIKMYLTIGDKFFIPGLTQFSWWYIKDVISANCLEITNHQWDNYKLESIWITDLYLD